MKRDGFQILDRGMTLWKRLGKAKKGKDRG